MTSDGVLRLDLGLGLEGLRSRLGLVSSSSSQDFLHKLFFMKFCKKQFLKKRFKNDCSKFSRSKRSVAKLSFFAVMLFARWRKQFTLNTVWNLYWIQKNVHVPMKPQRLISATTGWEYFAKDYLWTIYQEFCYETQRLIQKKWESANFEQL